MHNFVTAATNLMVFLIGALSGGDSITKCHIASVFQHSLAWPDLFFSAGRYRLAPCAKKEVWPRETSSSIPVFKRPGIILACALVMSYTLKEPDMMFTNALNRTNNNQISRDCRIESGSGVNSRKKGSRLLRLRVE